MYTLIAKIGEAVHPNGAGYMEKPGHCVCYLFITGGKRPVKDLNEGEILVDVLDMYRAGGFI